MSLFSNASFYTTVNHLKDLPITQAEIAFVGRSNAGKSSVINTLTHQTKLAFVSKTSGRTQYINFFTLAPPHHQRCIVDMPGYGFAQAPQAMRKHWKTLLGGYLQTRESLIGLIMIMDIRHPLKPLDTAMLDFFAPRAQPIHILLSKSDKLSRQQQNSTLNLVRNQLAKRADRAAITVQLFSSLKKEGVPEVESVMSRWFANTTVEIAESTL